MESTKFIKEILEFDPLDTAHQIGEKVGASEQEIGAFGFLLNYEHSRNKEEILKTIGDTYWGMSWEYAENFLKSFGFVEEYFEIFNLFRIEDEKPIPPEYYTIWFHEELPIMITLESYSVRVNSITAYYCIKQTEENKSQVWDMNLHNRSPLLFYNKEKNIDELAEQVFCKYDGREGLKLHLSEIKNFVDPAPWREKPFLYLLNYEQQKNNEDCETISLNKLKQCKSYKRIAGWE